MRLFAAAAVLVLAGLARSGAETLTLATYNVENYGPADRITDEGFARAYPKPEDEKKALRSVIRSLQADVLALQEMGPGPYLEELQSDLAAEGSAYPHAVLVEGGDSERHVALLSKRPLLEVIRHADLDFSYFNRREKVKRGLLEVSVSTEAGKLTLFVAHLKSHLTERPDDPEAAVRRASEARAVRDCILKKFPNPSVAPFVILGDFNDTRSSPTLRHLQVRGSLAVAFRLPAADDRGETWTENWHRRDAYVQADHILVSAPVRRLLDGAEAHIYDGPGVSKASDHRPVVLSLLLKPRQLLYLPETVTGIVTPPPSP